MEMRIFIFTLLIALGTAYKIGAPEEICEDSNMIPKHNGKEPQDNANNPFTLTASSLTYTPNQAITVTIRGKAGEAFKGFAVAALEGGTRIGQWQTTPGKNQQLKNCPIITHVNNEDKKDMELTWIAPDKSGSVEFQGTVVESGYVFYVNLRATQA